MRRSAAGRNRQTVLELRDLFARALPDRETMLQREIVRAPTLRSDSLSPQSVAELF